jgi:hypothetical protein
MADFLTKSCPRCGKRPLDPRLEQCPYCGVPFQLVPTNLTQEQLSAMTRYVLRSGKFWSVVGAVLILITVALAGLVHEENGRLSNEIARNSSNQITAATGEISERVSGEIAAEFQQPRIQAAIERVASAKAAEAISNGVWGPLEAFSSEMKEAQARLAQTRSDLDNMSNTLNTARIAAGHVLAAVSNEPPFLQLVDQAVTFNGSNYVLALSFKPSNSNPVGSVQLAAGTFMQTARIVSFTASNVEHVEPLSLDDAGDAAVIKFSAGAVDAPIIVALEITDATIVRMVSDSLEQPLTLPVHAELMRVPRASR